jgi:tetratricopeptide (TPR) repeat protein
MKAFLSHSSKDKAFVRQVADGLGRVQIEYDEYTFEFILNAAALQRALDRSGVFVLFLSENSVTSSFVQEEVRSALERRARGELRKILIFSIDGTSYRALPRWLQEINIVQRMSSAKACARKILATLIGLESQAGTQKDAYLGREEDERLLRRALAAPPSTAPTSLHAVGHFGIGRKTFLRETLWKLYPSDFEYIVEVPLQPFEGAEELYRRLYGLHVVASKEEMLRDFTAFGEMNDAAQVQKLTDLIVEFAQNREFVVIDDQGGAYTHAGGYQPYLEALTKSLASFPKPMLGFVQSRMMPLAARERQPQSYHHFLRPLSDESIKELLSFSLKQAGVDFNQEHLNQVAELLDGHPFNVKFATKAIHSYGMSSFLADPRDLVEWKLRRAEDFLRVIKFDEIECKLIAALTEYRFLPLEMFTTILQVDAIAVALSLRRLEDYCLVERRGEYFQISAPVRDALRRDKRFEVTDDWKNKLTNTIVEALQDYQNEDSIPVNLVESGAAASIRSGKADPFASAFVLPSHLLMIARAFYDKRQFKSCVEFCERAYGFSARMTPEARTETLRLWGLSLARAHDEAGLLRVIGLLRDIHIRVAQSTVLFLEGFALRLKYDLDGAEQKFLDCWKLGRENQSVNRELASLYCKQRRFDEAESYARSAYRVAPTNPFIIDILAESLLGRAAVGLRVDIKEIDRVLRELKVYGDVPGSSFYLIRLAQALARQKQFPQALKHIDRAIERTPALLPPYFIRAEICLSMSDVPGAERDLKQINEILERAGGFHEGEEAQVHELEARILIEKEQFRPAMNRVDNSAFLSKPVKRRLLTNLARTIGFVGTKADPQMQRWAKTYLGK